jgi:hypothetical protein
MSAKCQKRNFPHSAPEFRHPCLCRLVYNSRDQFEGTSFARGRGLAHVAPGVFFCPRQEEAPVTGERPELRFLNRVNLSDGREGHHSSIIIVPLS